VPVQRIYDEPMILLELPAILRLQVGQERPWRSAANA
jgi:hypothetical protein